MESIVNYLEDAEKKLAKEMAELFSKMREQRENMALNGIEDMYMCKPLEGVLYEPCLTISRPEGKHYAHVKLPKDEYVIDSFKHQYSIVNHPSVETRHYCIVLTNYGRLINTKPITSSSGPFNSTEGDGRPTTLTKIETLNILPYKFPSWFYNTFTKLNKSLCSFMKGGYTSSNSNCICPSEESLNKLAFDTTISLQELNKEFYLFAGKWKPHMTEHGTLDVDTMRQTIIDNTHSIHELKEKKESLEGQAKILETELKQLKEQNANLEKKNANLLPLEKYKKAFIEFMDEHYDGDESNVGVIQFSKWHSGKVFMDKWEYHEVMNSKDELNEYRIYKKIKSEMVSSGMDNSGVARNVRTIKRDVKKFNEQTG